MASTQIGHFEKVRALAAGPRLFALGGVRAGAASRVTIVDHVSGKVVGGFEVPAHVLGLALAGDLVLAGCSDGLVRAAKAATGELAWSFEAHTGAVSALAVSGDRLATAGADGALRLWSLRTRERAASFAVSGQALRAVALDPAGEVAAAAGDDGVVRAVTLATGERRDMPGHDGAVLALLFTPRDGRLASAGDDGTIRLHYLVGPLEHETRGEKDSGHAGAVTALAFSPTPPLDREGNDPGDRLFSAGADGKIKAWRLADRRKPRTLDAGTEPLFALVHLPAAPARAGAEPTSLGSVLTAGDARTLSRFGLDPAGIPDEAEPTSYGHGFDQLTTALGAARPAREAAVKTLAGLEEIEARELLGKALSSDRDPPVRALAATEIGSRNRRDLRVPLRARLDDEQVSVRAAAYAALATLEKDVPLETPRAAVESRFPDMRRRALVDLGKLGAASPLVRPMVAARLRDGDRGVRLAAIDALTVLSPAGSPEPLRVAYERGTPDVRVEVLVRLAMSGLDAYPSLAQLLGASLDDDAPDVRRTGFAVSLLARKPLVARVEPRDEELARTIAEIARRAAELYGVTRPAASTTTSTTSSPSTTTAPTGPSDDDIRVARADLPGTGAATDLLAEDDILPLLTAMACRAPDTALRGARSLAQVGDRRALGALLQLSREAEPSLRRRAALALAELDDAHADRRLAWMLDDTDADVRGAALDALGKRYVHRPLALVLAALAASQQDIRVRGLTLLVRETERGTPGVEPLLADALDDEAAAVRLEALRTLWALHKADPEHAVTRALAARFADVRRRAVDELVARKTAPWSRAKLLAAILDRDADVAQAAHDALVEIAGKTDPTPHLAAMTSLHATVRARAAAGAASTPVADVRADLGKLLEDKDPAVRVAALESLDRLLPDDAAPLRLGLQSSHLDLRVRAAELLAPRAADDLVDPMRALLADEDLARRLPPAILAPLRRRAASALATLGAHRTVRYLATELLRDDDPWVREQAARGLANASRPGDEGFLLDTLAHPEIAVRSWAADGLARLGDRRALPVLVGSLRHDHLPIRTSAVISFAALGPDGHGGMLEGLADASRDIQETVLMVVLARDLGAFRRGDPPELLASALAAARPDIRFAAARALELRQDPARYLRHLVEVILPPKPEKAADMKDWPSEERRARIAVGVAEALAGDRPAQRYAAAQVLLLRAKPRDFFREAEKVARPRLASAPWVPDTTPRAAEATDTAATVGWLRKLFHEGLSTPAAAVPDDDQRRLRALAFGAYVGLLRQGTTGDDEGHRVRRDATDRIVDLALAGHVARPAAIVPLTRALDDPHHLVRKAALAGLEKLYPAGSDTALSLALTSTAADIARAALDRLAQAGPAAAPRITTALASPVAEVRRHAFELLEKLSPPGSLDPLLAALGSEHTDLRLGVLERLVSAADPRVTDALGRATESEHVDVRLRAAELLAQRRDDRAADVLAALLRSDDPATATRAETALVALGSAAAVRVLAARADEVEAPARARLVRALGAVRRGPEAIQALALRLADEAPEVRAAALQAGLSLVARDPAGHLAKKRDPALTLVLLRAAARCKDPAIRLLAAAELATLDDPAAATLLVPLFADRDAPTRAAAVKSYATRVLEKAAPVEPLGDVLAAGTRELMLSAAEGVAAKSLPAALRPLLLFSRAGDLPERARALQALGYLGDPRALAELLAAQSGGTLEAPVEPELRLAATEALGRIHAHLKDPDAQRRVRDVIDDASRADDQAIAIAAARALRHLGGDHGRSRLEILLADGSSDLRVAAAESLGALADPAAEPALARAIASRDDDLSHAARAALTKLFPTERTRVALHALASPTSEIAEPAAAYLAREGDPAALLAHLATPTDEALAAALRYGLLRRPTLPVAALVHLLEQPAPAARENAAWLLGARTAPSREEGALGADGSPSASFTGAASPQAGAPVAASGLANPPSAVAPAASATTVGAGAVAAAAGSLSGTAGTPSGTAGTPSGTAGSLSGTAGSLSGTAGTPSGAVAVLSAADIASLGAALVAAADRARTAWERASSDHRPAEASAWQRILWAAARLGASGLSQPALAALAHPAAPASVRAEAARALGMLGSAEHAEPLATALHDRDPAVRSGAARALARVAPARAAREIAAIDLADPAAFAPVSPASPALLATPAGRRLTLPALLAAGDVVAITALAKDPAAERLARLDAIAALGRAGAAVDLLTQLAFDKSSDADLRKAAYRALRRARRTQGRTTPPEATP